MPGRPLMNQSPPYTVSHSAITMPRGSMSLTSSKLLLPSSPSKSPRDVGITSPTQRPAQTDACIDDADYDSDELIGDEAVVQTGKIVGLIPPESLDQARTSHASGDSLGVPLTPPFPTHSALDLSEVVTVPANSKLNVDTSAAVDTQAVNTYGVGDNDAAELHASYSPNSGHPSIIPHFVPAALEMEAEALRQAYTLSLGHQEHASSLVEFLVCNSTCADCEADCVW
jgi:hypothetical protein